MIMFFYHYFIIHLVCFCFIFYSFSGQRMFYWERAVVWAPPGAEDNRTWNRPPGRDFQTCFLLQDLRGHKADDGREVEAEPQLFRLCLCFAGSSLQIPLWVIACSPLDQTLQRDNRQSRTFCFLFTKTLTCLSVEAQETSALLTWWRERDEAASRSLTLGQR